MESKKITLCCDILHCEEYDDAFLSNDNKIVKKLEKLSRQYDYDVVSAEVVDGKLVIYGCYKIEN